MRILTPDLSMELCINCRHFAEPVCVERIREEDYYYCESCVRAHPDLYLEDNGYPLRWLVPDVRDSLTLTSGAHHGS